MNIDYDSDFEIVMKELKDRFGWSNIDTLPDSYKDLLNDTIKALKHVKNNGVLDDVILCDAPEEVLPCRHKCVSQCQLRGHCNYQKHKV